MFKNKIQTFILLGILGFLAFTISIFQRTLKVEPLPVYGKVSDFHLYDSSGREFSLKNLQNKIWVADFIFTTCGGICPVMTKNLAALHRSFLPLEGIEIVSISVNPENDTPQVLAKFAKKYNADTNKWHFLTGPRKEIKTLAVESFRLGSVDEPIFHSDRFVLVDARARIRGYYDGTQQKSLNALFKDMANLMKEKNK